MVELACAACIVIIYCSKICKIRGTLPKVLQLLFFYSYFFYLLLSFCYRHISCWVKNKWIPWGDPTLSFRAILHIHRLVLCGLNTPLKLRGSTVPLKLCGLNVPLKFCGPDPPLKLCGPASEVITGEVNNTL
jgi:hypothetical protein